MKVKLKARLHVSLRFARPMVNYYPCVRLKLCDPLHFFPRVRTQFFCRINGLLSITKQIALVYFCYFASERSLKCR